MPQPTEPVKKPTHFVSFQPTEESLHRSSKLGFGKPAAIFDSMQEQWFVFFTIVGVVPIVVTIVSSVSSGKLDAVALALTLFVLAWIVPAVYYRFRRTYRILREGVAVVGIVVSDSSPLAKPIFGKTDPRKHKGLRMTYVYHFNGQRYTGITGDISMRRPTNFPPLRSIPDSTGQCKIILLHPDVPSNPRATPEDVILNKKTRKRVSEELALTCTF